MIRAALTTALEGHSKPISGVSWPSPAHQRPALPTRSGRWRRCGTPADPHPTGGEAEGHPAVPV